MDVQANHAIAQSIDHNIRQHVRLDMSLSNDQRMTANSTELLNHNTFTQMCEIADRRMRGQLGVIFQNRVMTDPAIVTDVSLNHQGISITDTCDRTGLKRRMDRHVFSDRVPVAHVNNSDVRISERVLRGATNDRTFVDDVLGA